MATKLSADLAKLKAQGMSRTARRANTKTKAARKARAQV